jgi:hypothetical protein
MSSGALSRFARRHVGRQFTDNVAIGRRRALDKNAKARLDAELLYKRLAGITRHRR